jgi:hypothetical protein
MKELGVQIRVGKPLNSGFLFPEKLFSLQILIQLPDKDFFSMCDFFSRELLLDLVDSFSERFGM